MSNLRGISVARIGRDPEQKSSKNGKAYVTTSAAVDIGFGDSKETVWLSVTAFDDGPIRSLSAAKQGSLVNIVGDLRPRAYLDKNGEAKASLDFVLTSLAFVSAGRKSEDDGGGGRSSGGGRSAISGFADDDSVPF